MREESFSSLVTVYLYKGRRRSILDGENKDSFW